MVYYYSINVYRKLGEARSMYLLFDVEKTCDDGDKGGNNSLEVSRIQNHSSTVQRLYWTLIDK